MVFSPLVAQTFGNGARLPHLGVAIRSEDGESQKVDGKGDEEQEPGGSAGMQQHVSSIEDGFWFVHRDFSLFPGRTSQPG